ncbi:hypothetical protein [Microbacterium sp. CR_7]|uniref:hypothetical protein n=1 Tax=Microbacterium sp. CR_7 TaxID=3055792 RepID=UPI0035BFA094
MSFVVVGIALFALGAAVERSGRKLGTALALLPVLLWFGYVFIVQLHGDLGEREAADHATALLVGLLCFSAGQIVAGVAAGWLRKRRDSQRHY